MSLGVEGLALLETSVDLSGDFCLMIRLGQQLGIASFGIIIKAHLDAPTKHRNPLVFGRK
jgi:hypothetical protein